MGLRDDIAALKAWAHWKRIEIAKGDTKDEDFERAISAVIAFTEDAEKALDAYASEILEQTIFCQVDRGQYALSLLRKHFGEGK